MNSTPTILITNDNGFWAPGLRALINVMWSIGNVVVVAPDLLVSGINYGSNVSVVPVHFDFTAHYAVSTLQQWDLDAEKG